MPVVAGGNDNGVDAVRCDQSAQIGVALRFRGPFFCNAESLLIGVTQRGDIDSRDPTELPHHLPGTSPATDVSDANFIIGVGRL